MTVICRALARLVGIILMQILALAGLAIAIFSIGGGETGLSYPQLASWLQLPALRDEVGAWFDALAAPGPIAVGSLLGGAIAFLVGLVLLFGTLWPRRERMVHLEADADGELLARPRALAGVAGALVEQADDVTSARVRVRPRRRGTGGRLSVRAAGTGDAISEHAGANLASLTESFGLKVNVSARTPRAGERVK